jgi:hypothetical protein
VTEKWGERKGEGEKRRGQRGMGERRAARIVGPLPLQWQHNVQVCPLQFVLVPEWVTHLGRQCQSTLHAGA